MKKLIIVAMIAACVALCAAVWPHGNAVEETPVPAAETTVSAKEATVGEIEEPAALAEKEKGAVPQQEASQEERPEPETEPIEMPADSELQPSAEQSPTKNSAPEPTPSQPPKELQPGEKSMWRVSAGWSTRGQTTVKMVRIFTKTATKLGSRGEMCSCPLHSLPIRVIMITLNCCTVLNFDRS